MKAHEIKSPFLEDDWAGKTKTWDQSKSFQKVATELKQNNLFNWLFDWVTNGFRQV